MGMGDNGRDSPGNSATAVASWLVFMAGMAFYMA
jgi:hypothetical protein